jgi:dihydroorotate dehydrogenase electron transfer subunit
MPRDVTTAVLRNRDLGHGNHLLEFEARELIPGAAPGRFFMIGVPHADVLLRRPFSVCGLPGTFEDGARDGIQILYKVVGAGTALLASLRPGAEITVLGPLGQGFTLDDDPGERPVLVAGGIGSAPFPALTAALRGRGKRARLLYGARTASDLPLLEWFRGACDDVVVTTDDGSSGRRGLVTSALEDALRGDRAGLRLYACGPEPMLRAVARMAIDAGVACEVSLEAHMACGFGVCLGCVVPTRTGRWGEGGYERVCVEGPVMRAERLAW